MADLTAVPEWKPTIADLLLERKLQRVLVARLYAPTAAKERELAAQYTELLATASDEVRARAEGQTG